VAWTECIVDDRKTPIVMSKSGLEDGVPTELNQLLQADGHRVGFPRVL